MTIRRLVTLLLFAVVLVFGTTACGDEKYRPKTGETTVTEMNQTEENHKRLTAAQPPPKLDKSLERENLIRRLEFLNKEGTIGYVYLFSQNGIRANYAVKGKVSSLNSYLTNPMQMAIINISGGYHYEALPSPDFDGSYGENDAGIFFFTTDNVYVEYNGEYLYASQPLNITTPVQLTQQVGK